MTSRFHGDPAKRGNSSFSSHLPGLQIAWDSTSLGTLKECPRKYQYSLLFGLSPRQESVHLTFGLLYHAALERYDHARAAGDGYEAALHKAVAYCMEATWDTKRGRPWISDDKNKNRYTLVRSVVWYLEQFKDDSIETVILANGKPAVELSFRMQIEHMAPTGEPYLLCGHLDRLGLMNGVPYVVDRKTTKSTITPDFFTKYSPDNQFSVYSFASKIVYHTPVKGIIVDAVQIAVTFSRFQRGIVERKPDQLDEFYDDTLMWLSLAETFAQKQHWPQNDKSCGNYGGCPFRPICGKAPSVREEWMAREYVPRVWDPLRIRGDI